MKLPQIFSGLMNRFTLVCGVVVVGLVLFFFLGVYNLWSQINQKREELAKEEKKLENKIKEFKALPVEKKPGQESIKKYEEYRQRLENDEKACLDYYKKADGYLEAWFSGLSLERDGLPSGGAFYTNYGTERDKLLKSLKEKNIQIGKSETAGNEAEILGFSEFKSEERGRFRLLQKRFWIQERIINAIIKSKVTRCEVIDFTKGKPSRVTDIPAREIIPVGVTVYLPYKDITQFIYHLTDVSQGGFFIVIKEVNISRVVEQLGEYPERKRPTPQPDLNQKGTWQPPPIAPPLVRLAILCEVLDFDIK